MKNKGLYKFWWIRQAQSHQAYNAIFNVFDQIRNRIMQGYKEKLYAKRIIRKFQQLGAKKGETISDRNMNLIRMSQIAGVPFIRDTCVNRSRKIFADYLNFSAMNFNIKEVFIKFHVKVTKIQNRWKDIRFKNQKRYEFLIKLWDREVEIMSLYGSKHKGKNKKLKPLYKKLQVLSPEIKNKMILYYLQKRKHEHVANVYEWIEYNGEKEGKEFKSVDAKEFRITMVGNMNKFLFKGVDNAVLDSDYKKEQKALEKTIKIENKHIAEANA